MKKITMYQANDGVYYETEQEADRADRRELLLVWLEEVRETDWNNLRVKKLLTDVLDWVDAHYDKMEEQE